MNNYLLTGKKVQLFYPRQTRDVLFSQRSEEIIIREFVEGKKAIFYQLIRNFLFSITLTANHWFAGKKVLLFTTLSLTQ